MERTAMNSSKPGRQGRVLVVDDEAAVRKPICIAMAKAGYEAVEAEDGEHAIRVLNEGDNPLMIDAILCDIRMPRINGAEAIAHFRAQYPTIPIVVLTGYPDVHLATNLMKQGVTDYLVKPVTKDQLLDVIRNAVGRHVVMDNQFVV